MEKKTTILYIITSSNVGGTERALLKLIKRLDRTRFDILVCSLKKEGVFAEKIKEYTDGFYCLELSESGGIKALLNFLPALISLFFLVRCTKPDIIHSFLFRANIIGRLAGRLAGVKNIISSIRVIEADKPLKHFLDRITSSLVTVYTAVSEAARKFTIKQIGLSPDKIITIQNGIDCSLAERTFSGEFKTNKAKVNIGLFGRLDKQKGHLVLLNAVKKLISKEKEIQVFFFGEGPYEDSLREIVIQEGLSEYINLMGTTDNVYSCILQMDIIAIPSYWEGLPNILLESMVLGRPVIAARIAGITEVVTNNINALLFNSGDEDELSEAIQRLICNRNFADKLGTNARKHVIKNFPIEKSVQKTTELYLDLLEKNKALDMGL